ncbi:MAG: glycosyltransferase [Acidobacteriota bacterium]
MILLAGQAFGPWSGPGVFSQRLARGLVECGYEVTFVMPATRFRHGRRCDHSGARIETVPSLSLGSFYPDVHVTPNAERSIEKLFDRLRPSIVHVQDHHAVSRGVVRAAARRGVPVVATNHFLPGDLIPHVPVLSTFSLGRKILETILWRTVTDVFSAAQIVTTPTDTAALIMRQKLEHIPIRAISNGVELRRFHGRNGESVKAARFRFGLDSRQVLLLYLGRVDREKRLDVLIRALALSRRTDVQFAVAGQGRDVERLRDLAAALDLGHRVVFLGFVNDDELPSLLRCADLFAMPSDVELQSIATLEAMASGLPVLAADAGALPELVDNGVNGFLFRPCDPQDASRRLLQILHARQRWAKMGEESARRAREHAIEQTISAYGSLYEELLSGRDEGQVIRVASPVRSSGE